MNDYAEKIINSLFGSADWSHLLAGDFDINNSILLSIFAAFNTIALAAVAGVSVYMLTVGTVGTAHEGQALGKKYNSVWAPLRLSLSIASLAPLPVIKLSMMQLLILSSISFSFSFANKLTDMVGGFAANHGGAVTIKNAPNMDFGDNAYTLLKANAFAHSLVYYSHFAGYISRADDKSNIISKKWDEDFFGKGGKWIYSIKPRLAIDHKLVSVGTFSLACESQSAPSCKKQQSQVESLQRFIDELSRQIVNKKTNYASATANFDRLQRGVQKTNQARAIASDSPANAVHRRELVAAQMTKGGWAGLGSFGFELSRQNMQLAEKVKLHVSASFINKSSQNKITNNVLDVIDHPNFDEVQETMQRVDEYAGKFNYLFPTSQQLIELLKTGHEGDISAAFSVPIMMMYNSMLDSIIEGGNPTVILADTGQTMLGISDAIFLSGATAKAAAGLTVIGASAGDVVWSICEAVGSLLFLGGAFFAFYLPALPFMLYMLGVIAVFIVIVEALIAAPLWAIGMGVSSGEGMVGDRGQAGFIILANVMLRPALLVVSFTVALLLSLSIMPWLARGLQIASNSLTAHSVVGIPSLACLLLLSGVTFGLVYHKIWSIINWLPDNVMKWIGGTEQKMGGQDNFGGNFTAVAGKIGGVTNRLPHSRGGSGEKKGGDEDGAASIRKLEQDLEPGKN